MVTKLQRSTVFPPLLRRSVFVCLFISLSEVFGQPNGGSVVLSGSITNGTRGGAPAVVEKLELVSLAQGMQIVQTLERVGPQFAFAPVPQPRAPYLIRATYNGESYNTMVPPAPRFYAKPQRIEVFESGAPRAQVQMFSGLEVTKQPTGGLRVRKIFGLVNESKPPRSFSLATLKIYIPAGATNLRGNLTHSATRMPVPLSLEALPDEKGFYRIQRGARPGESQLAIEFELPEVEFEDFATRYTETTPGAGHDFLFVLWQPADARPLVDGVAPNVEDIPNVGPALRLSYPTDRAVRFDFRGGGVFYENPMEAHRNPILDTEQKTALGLAFVLVVFFLIASLLSASGLRLVRAEAGPGEKKREADNS